MTDPHQGMLYREFRIQEAKKLINIASPLLKEVVNYSTMALVRALDSSDWEDKDIAPFSLYRQMIEVTDGIEILISQSAPMPALPLLRTSFEAIISIEFILQDLQHYEERSLAWLVGYVRDQIKTTERFDSESLSGKEFRESFRNDLWFTPELEIEELPTEVIEEIEGKKRFLKKSHIGNINHRFNEVNGTPYWYKIFGFQTLRDLAKHIGRGGQYDFLYREWTRYGHGRDRFPIKKLSNGEFEYNYLRNATELGTISSFAVNFLCTATRVILGFYRPTDDSYQRWYTKDISQPHRLLANNKSR